MSELALYELNPRRNYPESKCPRCGQMFPHTMGHECRCQECGKDIRKHDCACMARQNPPGLGPRQRAFGAGGGYMDGRGGWHAGGGRYLDPGYLPADYPDGTYHAGGGQVSHGFHGGGGYYSNPYGGSMLDEYESPYNQNPPGGSVLDGYQSPYPYSQNPVGLGPRQRSFAAGGGHFEDGGYGDWHAGGGRYLDPGYLPANYPDGTYHAGGGQVSHGFQPGSGYYSNPPCARCGRDCGCGCGGDPAFCTCSALSNPGSMLEFAPKSSYRYRLPKPSRDPYKIRAFNNPPRCRNCGCHP
jgi:hypothetical protein